MTKTKREKISVVGSGVVGQATGRGFITHGYDVQFVDVIAETVEKLNSEGLEAYTVDQIADEDTSDVTIFTVSTPTENGAINLSYLEQAAIDLGKRLRGKEGYHLVVVRSTVLPGTTEGMVLKRVEEHSGLKAGHDFGVCMNPEYLREITAVDDFKNPWLTTIGQLDERSGDILARLYEGYDCPVYRVTLLEAEVQKYVHNIYNAAKISYFNEMRGVCEKLNIDADAIFPIVARSCEGMWNAVYGTKNLGPYSGMCLPKDTQAFYAWAQSMGWEMAHLKATIDVNAELAVSRSAKERPVETVVSPVVEVARA